MTCSEQSTLRGGGRVRGIGTSIVCSKVSSVHSFLTERSNRESWLKGQTNDKMLSNPDHAPL